MQRDTYLALPPIGNPDTNLAWSVCTQQDTNTGTSVNCVNKTSSIGKICERYTQVTLCFQY